MDTKLAHPHTLIYQLMSAKSHTSIEYIRNTCSQAWFELSTSQHHNLLRKRWKPKIRLCLRHLALDYGSHVTHLGSSKFGQNVF